MSGTVFIISAPSGSGKSTLTNELLKSVPDLEFSISYTTRPPRGSEQNGREYFFVSRPEFERMIEAGEFLEHACVFGDYYGTARRFLQHAKDKGNDLVLDIDVQGAAQVKRRIPEDAVSIFILPPSRAELEKRLRRRSEGEKQLEDPQRKRSDEVREKIIQKRLSEAGREIANYPEYDYILVNDQLEQSIDRLKAIVSAERLKRSQGQLTPQNQPMLEAADRCLLRNVRSQVLQILDSFTASAPR